jgi:hypothetical protein
MVLAALFKKKDRLYIALRVTKKAEELLKKREDMMM